MEILKESKYKGVKVQIVLGDITEEDVDAIVNAANRFLRHGGGVAGAIVRKGGKKIQEESDEYVRTHGPLRTGEAVVTSGGRLKAKYVIHTVGPIWRGDGTEDSLLYKAIFNALLRACDAGAVSVSMPAISTGIYGFPKERAVPIFARAIKDFIDSHPCVEKIRICNIDPETANVFKKRFKI